jgi:signal transduction histidine kinase
MQARRIAPWGAVCLTLAGLGFAATLSALAPGYGDGTLDTAGWVVATLAPTAVGLLLTTRRGDNPIGWLLLAGGLVLALSAVAACYADYAVLAEPGALPGGEWAVLYTERAWPLLFVCITAIAFLFPDGRLPSPGWRKIAIATVVLFAAYTLASLLSGERYGEDFAHVSNPLPELPEPIAGLTLLVSGLGALAGLVAAALAVRTRLRSASGIERYQLRWLSWAAVLIPVTVVVCLVEIAITGEEGPAVTAALVVTMTAISAAIGIAITRHRLYELDRLVSRALTYAVLTAGLAVTFAAVALSLGVAIGSGSTLPTAAATLAVALAFGPLRSRIQRAVDRRFDRARYEGLHKVERFLGELRAGRAAPERIGAVLAEALDDPDLELFFWLPGEDLHIDAAGHVVPEARLTGRARTPVRRADLRLATVVHDPSLEDRPDLLRSVIEAAGLAIEIARLRVEVRRRLAEVEESRARIVTAGYEERRRLERDLHDGAQQRLVSIGLSLRHVQGQLPESSPAAKTLNATVGEVSDAIEELRELASGVRPAGLDDGLSTALRELASRSPLPTRIDVTNERFEGRLETAAFFVASEALANAAKHADASEVRVSAARQNGSLVLRVRDDGCGGALPGQGSGLAGMSDRVAALGGRLDVESPPGRGTVVTAELPCES